MFEEAFVGQLIKSLALTEGNNEFSVLKKKQNIIVLFINYQKSTRTARIVCRR